MSYVVSFLAVSAALAVQASAPLAVQAQAPTPVLAGAPAYASASASASAPSVPDPDVGSRNNAPPDAGHAKECYAKVKFGAQYSVAPPSAPHYSWRQEPGPPGSPGPIWCLVPDVSAPRQVMISPERYGWIRVLCDTEATPARIVDVQRQLSAAGVYQGPIDGRYNGDTTAALQRFQTQRHIEDRGYLSYATLTALSGYSQSPHPQNAYPQGGYAQGRYDQNGYYQVPSPQAYAAPYPYAYPQARPWPYGYGSLTTFDTGVLTWPGKR
jgi:hypothetical protein